MRNRRNDGLAAAHQGRIRLLFSVVAAALLALAVTGISSVLPSARGYYASGGDLTGNYAGFSEPYLGTIDWVDFSQAVMKDGSQRTFTGNKSQWLQQRDIPATFTSTTDVDTSQLVTTCTLSNIWSGRIQSNFDGLAPYMPGNYSGDSWDNFYGAHRVTGLGTNSAPKDFDIHCDLTLHKDDGSTMPIPFDGLVFANAEAIDRGEFVNITPEVQGNATPWWHVLEYEVPAGCSSQNRLYVGSELYPERNGLSGTMVRDHTLQMGSFSSDGQCTGGAPFLTTFARNAVGAHVHIDAHGFNAIAIGVVVSADTGDALSSYGTAAALVQPKISGGDNIPTGSDNLSSTSKAAVSAAAAGQATVDFSAVLPRLGAQSGDPDFNSVQGKATENGWFTMVGDDIHDTNPADKNVQGSTSIDDEDAVDRLVVYPRTGFDYSLTVKCTPASTGTSYVAGWLDWNHNGKFDTQPGGSEKTTTTCEPSGFATLTWSASQLQPLLLSDQVGAYRSALRLMISTDDQLVKPGASTSMMKNGEVEDHAVTLLSPGIDLSTSVVDESGEPTNYQDSATGTNVNNGWQFTGSTLMAGGSIAQAGLLKPASQDGALLSAQTPVQTDTRTTSVSGAQSAGHLQWNLALNPTNTANSTIVINNPAASRAGTSFAHSDTQIVQSQKTNDDGTALYQVYPHKNASGAWDNARCVARSKPADWDDSIWAYPDTTAGVGVYTNIGGVDAAQPGFKLSGLAENSILDCTMLNQPYGTFTVRTIVDTSATGLAAGDTTRRDIQQTVNSYAYSGTWTCTVPDSSPYHNVDGTYSFTPANFWPTTGSVRTVPIDERSKIPLGSTCTVTQTKVTMPNLPEDRSDATSSPFTALGSTHHDWVDAYRWGSLTYRTNQDAQFSQFDNVLTAASSLIGESPAPVTVQNSVTATAGATLTWQTVDQDGNALGGARFTLRYKDERGASVDRIVRDCQGTADTGGAQCEGYFDQDPRPGFIREENVRARPGGYTVIQSMAPGGYILSNQDASITVYPEDRSVSCVARTVDPPECPLVVSQPMDRPASWTDNQFVNIKVKASMLPGLPLTGGLGQFVFSLIGGVIVGAATIVALQAIRRSRRQASSSTE
ncbi:MAG: CshA/CshB family fibrillar adhesin-related protein [Actinomycetaceae bacterium]|nr:CshA/CshB family fibrillar adhesin-related protein [Actinomycetaceae bacterium]MDY6083003.1 CshA/CshB family fibrillar adhesin-related protein [Actinomycetaceae bacterium]